MKYLLTALTLALFAGSTALAREVTIEPERGWVPAEQIEEAFEIAEEEQRPIALLFTAETVKVTGCPTCVGRKVVSQSRQYMNERTLSGMVRVVVQGDARKNEYVQKLAKQVHVRMSLPALIIADANLNIIGFVHRGMDADEEAQVFQHTRQILAWQAETDQKLKVMDRSIDAGRFSAAIKQATAIAEQDEEITRVLLNGEAGGSKDDIDHDQPVEGRFYPELASKTKTRAEQRGQAIVEDARKLIDEGELVQASQLLGPMVADGYETAALDKAKQLINQITQSASAKQ